VGIAGGSGSGKTTITAGLMNALGDRAVLLQHDWYYRDQAAVPVHERTQINYDHPDALETGLLIEHVTALRAGLPVEVPQYDFATHTRATDTLKIVPRTVVVVEGINTLADPHLRALFDLTVFVDAPADIRFIRRLQRDLVERERTVDSVVAQYLEQVRPMHDAYVEPGRVTADIVLSGEAPVSESVGRVLSCLGLDGAPD